MFNKFRKYLLAAATGIIVTATVTAGSLAASTCTATTAVNVRSGASNSSSVVTVLSAGQSVTQVGTSGNWIKISANGKTGYVYKRYLTSGGTVSSSTSTSSSSSSSSNASSSNQSSTSSSKGTYMGKYKLTFYAGDTSTASGRSPRVNHTIAADTSVLPMYTQVYIEGWGTYTVEDRGGAIKGKRIDIFVNSESTAYKYGVQYANVYLA